MERKVKWGNKDINSPYRHQKKNKRAHLESQSNHPKCSIILLCNDFIIFSFEKIDNEFKIVEKPMVISLSLNIQFPT